MTGRAFEVGADKRQHIDLRCAYGDKQMVRVSFGPNLHLSTVLS